MNVYLIQLIGKIFSLLIVALTSLFNTSVFQTETQPSARHPPPDTPGGSHRAGRTSAPPWWGNPPARNGSDPGREDPRSPEPGSAAPPSSFSAGRREVWEHRYPCPP